MRGFHGRDKEMQEPNRTVRTTKPLYYTVQPTPYSFAYVLYSTGNLSIDCFLRTPVIGPSHKVQLLMNNNSLTCDCRDYDIIVKLRTFNRTDWLDGVKCNLPSQLYGKAVRYTVCHSTERTPDKLF